VPSWAARLIDELEASDRRAIAIAGSLTAEELNWRLRPESWSAGQCLDHLRAASDAYLPPIEGALAGRKTSPVEEIEIGWFGRWFIRSYIAPSEQTKRGVSPRKIVPASELDAGILDRFLQSNERIREAIRRASPYDVNHIRFRNPFVPVIRFTVGTGFEILSRHEDRHLLQAEHILAARAASARVDAPGRTPTSTPSR
jgi:hypothetical protein